MFLDDKLIQICEKSTIRTDQDIQNLNQEIMSQCDLYRMDHITMDMTPKEVLLLFKRIDNLFDSFVQEAKKHKDIKLRVLGKLFEKLDYHYQVRQDTKMNELITKLENNYG